MKINFEFYSDELDVVFDIQVDVEYQYTPAYLSGLTGNCYPEEVEFEWDNLKVFLLDGLIEDDWFDIVERELEAQEEIIIEEYHKACELY